VLEETFFSSLYHLILLWRWKRQVISHCWYLCARLHGVTSRNP